MPAPTHRFREIPNTTLATALDSAAKRINPIADQVVKSTGVGNEVDFGTIDISAGAANGPVKTILFDITDPQGNTVVDTCKLWASSLGLTLAGSKLKFRPLSGADQATPTNTAHYVQSANVNSYVWADMPEAEPPAQNVWPSNEAPAMALVDGHSFDAIMWAMYPAIAAGEKTGTYKGTDAGYQFQMAFKFSYS
jgi:hypothetical protein